MYLRWTFHVPRGAAPLSARGQKYPLPAQSRPVMTRACQLHWNRLSGRVRRPAPEGRGSSDEFVKRATHATERLNGLAELSAQVGVQRPAALQAVSLCQLVHQVTHQRCGLTIMLLQPVQRAKNPGIVRFQAAGDDPPEPCWG